MYHSSYCSHGWIHTDRATTLLNDFQFPDPSIRRLTSFDLTMESAEDNFTKGLQLKADGEHAKACEAFHAATQLKWNFTAAHIELGNAASTLKNYDRALKAYQEAIETDPLAATAYYNIALTYIDLSETVLAADWLTRTLKIDPQYRPAYIQTAQLLSQDGRDRSAIYLLIKAAYLKPYSAPPLVSAGKLYHRNTQPAAAIRCYERALRIDAWNTHAFYHLGFAQYHRGELAKAIRSLAHSVNSDPSNKLAAALLKTAYAALRPKKRAKKPIQDKLFDLAPDSVAT
jgi:tetratricopeptide (TPR) repeat protein